MLWRIFGVMLENGLEEEVEEILAKLVFGNSTEILELVVEKHLTVDTGVDTGIRTISIKTFDYSLKDISEEILQ